MSLRKKVVLILLLVTVLSVTVNYVVQEAVLTPSYTELERLAAQRDIDRCVRLLQREIDNLDQTCFDWAAWDDTYDFMLDSDSRYVASNLVLSTFTDNKINLMYFINTKGRVVWGRAYDLEELRTLELQDFPHGAWAVTHPLLQHKRPTHSIAGVFLTVAGPMLISSCPIVHSDNEGPIRGALVMGRWLGDARVKEIGALANVRLHVWPLRQGYVPAKIHAVMAEFPEGQRHYIKRVSSRLLNVYTVFLDVTGRPGLLLEADIPRSITEQGRAAVRFTARATLLVALGVLVVLLVFLRSSVTTPLTHLTTHVGKVNRSSELALITDIRNQDEIGRLTREFNNMVRRLQGDTAQREQAERALQQSEARMRAILATAPDGVITVNDDGTIESFNPAACRMFGYTPEEAVGRPVGMLVAAPSDTPPADALSGFLRTEVSDSDGFGREFLGKGKDGTTFPVHITKSRLGPETPRVYILIARDITDLNRMHEQLRQAEHLATIGELGASVAHEIRNPLAGISGAAQILKSRKVSGASQDRAVEEILNQVGRMERTVQDFLLFSRPWQPDKRRCNLRDLAQELCRSTESQEAFRTISFTFAGEDALYAPVDASLVHQVLWNVIQNAAQAMSGGGEIRCAFIRRRGEAVVKVRDTGCGMTPDQQEEAFRPFFTTKTQGTGLGLSICRSIMEAHGGQIIIESALGEGTEVTLVFPTED